MYGHFHVILRDLITRKFGAATWEKVLEEADEDDIEHFLTFKSYDDSITVNIMASAAKVLEIPIDAVLEVYGEYFILYSLESGYDNMLRSLGSNFREFMQNLDNLHSQLEITYRDMNAPSFRCDPLESDGSMNLHYYSTRGSLLHPLVTGMLRATGREIFGLKIGSEVIAKEEIQLSDETQIHVTFRVTGVTTKSQHHLLDYNMSDPHLVVPDSNYISPRRFCQIFPYHVIFDSRDLTVRQCGENIPRMSYGRNIVGEKMSDIARLHHPRMEFTSEKLLEFINLTYVLEIVPSVCVKVDDADDRLLKNLLLKGQMIVMEDKHQFLFIGSPRVSSLDEIQKCNMYMSDIPLHDATRELIMLNEKRGADIQTCQNYDKTSAVLKRLNKALVKEKKRSDTLLYEMLPKTVADSLKEGEKSQSETFDSATILFSSVDNFHDIAHELPAEDSVELLNALYLKLDSLIAKRNVYKVETVGDVYMVVGGVPLRSPDHACLVADFALDMLEASRDIVNPITCLPLQLRIGMHTGAVCAGVIGDKCPRYCLFGNTVNVASRMQSRGVAGQIHMSGATYTLLEAHEGYRMESRGSIEIKGKGKMETYFLRGANNREPDYLVDPLMYTPASIAALIIESSQHNIVTTPEVQKTLEQPSTPAIDLLADLNIKQEEVN